jgi:hypothetical protein
MSTLLATNIQDRATLKSLGIERVVEGSAKAWIVYVVSAAAVAGVPEIRGSFNFSSITDTALGDSRPNITAPMSGSFSVVATCSPNISWDNRNWSSGSIGASQTQVSYVEQGTSRDPGAVSLGVMGRLA